MTNKFEYTLDNKRYHTFNYFLRNKFNSKVFKIPLDANASCPNKSTGGCIFCKENSKANITDASLSLKEQYLNEANILNKKWPNAKHIVYFQTGSNTYMDTNLLKSYCEPFLEYENVVGISIATRPDCISDECYDYLKDLNKRTFLTVELGLQSSNNNTLSFINRGHNKECFKEAVLKLHKYNIFVVAHIINGLPYETKEDMLNTALFLNELKIEAIKIHMLHILKDTKLAEIYKKNNFHVLSKDEYIDIVISQLEVLDPKVVIERITGDPIKEDLIAPDWLTKKFVLLNDIDKQMVKLDTYQGQKK